jgi:glutamate 5-kinase
MNGLEVVKFGSSQVANGAGLDRSRIEDHVSRIADIPKLIVVTSGAAAAGRALYYAQEHEQLPETLENQRYFAGLGCTVMFYAFEEAFRNLGRTAASYPITHPDLDETNAMFLAAIDLNLQRNTAVVVNEADAFSDIELMKLKTGGENDGLALHVARTFGADRLTIVTNKGGLVDNDGRLIEVVNQDNIAAVKEMVSERAGSEMGRGGIVVKTAICWEGAQAGIQTQITNADRTSSTQFVVG